MKHGHYVVGRLKGIAEIPWRNGQGVSTKLGIACEYTDRYGEVKEETFELDVFSQEIQRVAQTANQLRGQLVAVSYLRQQKKGPNGNWFVYAIGRESTISPLSEFKNSEPAKPEIKKVG